MQDAILLLAAAAVTLALPLRLLYLLYVRSRNRDSFQVSQRRPNETCATAVFLGGHTGEMVRLLSALDFERYTPRVYFVTAGDVMSLTKLGMLEQSKASGRYHVHELPRARRVHQSFWSTPFTTLYSFFYALKICTWTPLVSRKPVAEVLLLNGPGTAVPLALACFLSRLLWVPNPKLIYIESFARVSSLSLSGKLLRPFVDHFVVHWPQLAQRLSASSWIMAPVEHVPNLLLPPQQHKQSNSAITADS